jgi:hypothetical protein
MPHREEEKVTFIDRRKITADGEIRPEAEKLEEAEEHKAAKPLPAQESPTAAGAAASSQVSGQGAPPQQAPPASTGEAAEAHDSALPEGPTAQETAESHAAYNATTQKLDELLRGKGPDAGALGPATFENLVQSMYMTAMISLGAGTPEGEKPRVDLMGARQTVDLLGVLQEKTRNNLTPNEQRLLESALFELRMTFLEITNAIARNAANPPKAPGGKPK